MKDMNLLNTILEKINFIQIDKHYEAEYILINPKDSERIFQKCIDNGYTIINKSANTLFGVQLLESAEITEGNPKVVTTLNRKFQ